MAGWGGLGKDTIVWDGEIRAKKFSNTDGSNPFSVSLNEVGNPTADKTFTMNAESVSFTFTNPSNAPNYDGAFEIQANGAFSGDLLHVHQHTGNPGATDLVHLEATDSDVVPLNISATNTNSIVANKTIKTTLATGTKPIDVTSTTLCTNLNADLLDGKHTGTSGDVVPLCNGNNTYSGTAAFSSSTPVHLQSVQDVAIDNPAFDIFKFGVDGGSSYQGTPFALRWDSSDGTLAFYEGTGGAGGMIPLKTSKVYSTGGVDPPYVLYDPMTFNQINNLISNGKNALTTSKKAGMVMFFNKDTNQIELYCPQTNKRYKLSMTEINP